MHTFFNISSIKFRWLFVEFFSAFVLSQKLALLKKSDTKLEQSFANIWSINENSSNDYSTVDKSFLLNASKMPALNALYYC